VGLEPGHEAIPFRYGRPTRGASPSHQPSSPPPKSISRPVDSRLLSAMPSQTDSRPRAASPAPPKPYVPHGPPPLRSPADASHWSAQERWIACGLLDNRSAQPGKTGESAPTREPATAGRYAACRTAPRAHGVPERDRRSQTPRFGLRGRRPCPLDSRPTPRPLFIGDRRPWRSKATTS
jgi:hypothetical protein